MAIAQGSGNVEALHGGGAEQEAHANLQQKLQKSGAHDTVKAVGGNLAGAGAPGSNLKPANHSEVSGQLHNLSQPSLQGVGAPGSH